jgi:hypothetical protein
MVSLYVAVSMLLAFSMLLGVYSTTTASLQLVDHVPFQLNDGAAVNPFLSSVSSKSVSERSYDMTEFSSQANLDGYVINSFYRSDRGVTFCGGPLIYADSYKMNTCKTVEFSYSYNYLSVMVVANSTAVFTKTYSDKKCQNLLRSQITTYTAGACVGGKDKTSFITSINTKISTDLTAPRVTRV